MKTLVSTNPITAEKLWEGIPAEESDVDAAVVAAKTALPEWSSFPLEVRAEVITSFKELLESRKNTFAELISKETGKPLWEALQEVGAMIAKVDISIDAQKRRCSEAIRELPGALSTTRYKPLGVVAVLGPFNFPGHLPNGHIVPALLAGNTVVFKPSELTPFVGEEMVRLWKESGLPTGVLNIVQGGSETGRFLSRHPDINALLFTGSWKTGKVLAELFGHHPEKLLALEMGGNNPLIIGEISDFQAAAYLTVLSAYLTSGQRCTCARRLIIPKDATGDSFLETLIEIISKVKVGAYTEIPEPFMGPVITTKVAKNLLSAQENLLKMGGIPLLKMKVLQDKMPLLSPGLLDVTNVDKRPDEEYFGPLLQVIRVADFHAAMEEANNTAYGLSAAIFSDNQQQYEQFYKQSRAGVVNWNTQTTGASSAAPFGGVGHSGNFRPSAFYAADYCNYPVASMEAKELTMPKKLTLGIKL